MKTLHLFQHFGSFKLPYNDLQIGGRFNAANVLLAAAAVYLVET